MSASFSQPYLELLKSQVLETAGFNNLSPADCKTISALTNVKTRQCVSETTFKRLYGFALSKFKPSLFTIDVLAKYCDYAGWKDFCDRQKSACSKSGSDNTDWYTLRQCAIKVTEFTIQAIKNRSGIPYSQTISREFMPEHFNGFEKSGSTGTILYSPAAHGKTIALCHWIEDKIEQSSNGDNDDIILFFSTSALMSALLCGRNMHDWILALLGYSADTDIDFLLDNTKSKKGTFYLVIDGFDEHLFKKEEFEVMLNQLADLLSFHQPNTWFKLILTMRSSSWLNSRHLLESGSNTLYTGLPFKDNVLNIPLFSCCEIKQLCSNINPFITNFSAIENSVIFTNPLYFQFYYKQNKAAFNLNNIDNIALYELISIFMLNKVYLGQFAADKITLIRGLVEHIDLRQNRYEIDILEVNILINKYHNAFQELLSIGFLRKLNESNGYKFNTYIEFGNADLLNISIAKALLFKNDDKFDSALIQTINTQFADNSNKLPVLKWCLMHAIKTGQQDSFGRLPEIILNANEKAALINFLGDLLDKEWPLLKKNEAFVQYFAQDFNKELFDYFFGLELINNDYKKTLNTLLKFELSNRKKILVTTALSILALINLDLNELNSCLTKLKSFSKDDYLCFAVNPLTCLDTIYNYLKFGVVKKDALIHLTKLLFNAPEDAYNLNDCASNDLLYLLGLYTSVFFNNPRKTFRLVNLVKNFYKDDCMDKRRSEYTFFVNILIADTQFKCGNKLLVEQLYYTIANYYEQREDLLSPYMKTLLQCLKIKVLIDTPQEGLVIGEMENLKIFVNESGSALSRFATLTMLLNKGSFLAKHPLQHRQYYYEYTKIVSEFNLVTRQSSVQSIVYK